MKEWIISDTHAGHANIIKYCDRPFNNVDKMNDHMIEEWNKLVGKNDIVWHLGDVGMGKSITYFLTNVNGKINLILGNHDKGTYDWWLGWVEKVYDKPILYNNHTIFSHYPLPLPPPNYPDPLWINVHGHEHNNPHTYEKSPQHINVSVELINYKPKLLKEVLF